MERNVIFDVTEKTIGNVARGIKESHKDSLLVLAPMSGNCSVHAPSKTGKYKGHHRIKLEVWIPEGAIKGEDALTDFGLVTLLRLPKSRVQPHLIHNDDEKTKETLNIELTNEEKIELSYLHLQGFSYLVRNEIGSVEVFVNKPHRDKVTNNVASGGYDTWVERAYPMTDQELKRRKHTELGEYKFVTWESEPMLIKDLISTN